MLSTSLHRQLLSLSSPPTTPAPHHSRSQAPLGLSSRHGRPKQLPGAGRTLMLPLSQAPRVPGYKLVSSSSKPATAVHQPLDSTPSSLQVGSKAPQDQAQGSSSSQTSSGHALLRASLQGHQQSLALQGNHWT